MTTNRNRRRRERQKEKRQQQLKTANKTGWKQCSEYHYQRMFGAVLVDWWPSTSKIMIKNQVYRIIDESDIAEIVKHVELPQQAQS